jgi:hypothetical protein
LDQKERSRVRRLAKVKTKEAKTKKSKRKHDKLAEDTKIAKKELHRREGTYRRGMNLDDPEDEAEGTDDRPPKRARLTSTNTKGNHCEYCGKSNHLTKRSKKCTAQEVVVKRFLKDGTPLSADGIPLPPGARTEPANLSAEALLAQQDCDAMDSMPFDAEYDSELDLARFLLDGGYDSDDGSLSGHIVGAL